jgi:hypothetical protein
VTVKTHILPTQVSLATTTTSCSEYSNGAPTCARPTHWRSPTYPQNFLKKFQTFFSMTDFTSAILKTVVVIDGAEYTIETCDYSESVTQAIEDGACDGTSQDIIDFILEN